jgi:predicted esterase
MLKLFEKLGFNTNNKVVLQGYDLGGAIALSCCLNPKLAKCISSIIVFHPTWTDSV